MLMRHLPNIGIAGVSGCGVGTVGIPSGMALFCIVTVLVSGITLLVTDGATEGALPPPRESLLDALLTPLMEILSGLSKRDRGCSIFGRDRTLPLLAGRDIFSDL